MKMIVFSVIIELSRTSWPVCNYMESSTTKNKRGGGGGVRKNIGIQKTLGKLRVLCSLFPIDTKHFIIHIIEHNILTRFLMQSTKFDMILLNYLAEYCASRNQNLWL